MMLQNLFQHELPSSPSLFSAVDGIPAKTGIRSSVAVLVCVLLFVTGCSETHTIRGTVTYDGKPVEKGGIAFLPVDGQGPSFGAKIIDGAYYVENASPGSRKVQIIGVKKINFARSSAELERMADEALAAGKDPNDLVEPADVIPEDAEGNNQVVEIEEGAQTLDFDIMPPAR